MKQLNLQLKLDSSNNSIENLEGFIKEERIRGLRTEIQHKKIADGSMGALAPDTLQLIATILGSGAAIAFVNKLFDCIKTYIQLNKNDMITLESGEKKISFHKDNVENTQQIIEDFMAIESGNDLDGEQLD